MTGDQMAMSDTQTEKASEGPTAVNLQYFIRRH